MKTSTVNKTMPHEKLLDVKKEKGNKMKAFFKYTNKGFDLTAILATFAIILTVVLQIAGRLVGKPAPWTEEATRFIFIWMIFLGIGIGFRQAESARVTYFLKWMPKFVQRGSIWLYMIATIGFFAFMLVTGTQLMLQQFTMNEMGSALMIPMWIIGLSLPVSAIVGILGVIESYFFHRDLLEPEEE